MENDSSFASEVVARFFLSVLSTQRDVRIGDQGDKYATNKQDGTSAKYDPFVIPGLDLCFSALKTELMS